MASSPTSCSSATCCAPTSTVSPKSDRPATPCTAPARFIFRWLSNYRNNGGEPHRGENHERSQRQVAVVNGGSKGIGRATAGALAAGRPSGGGHYGLRRAGA